MNVRTIYYQNTNPGHNKDYSILADYDTLEVTSTWGPIGGTHNTRVETARNLHHISTIVLDKMAKRESRGYKLISDDRVSTAGMPVGATATTRAPGTLNHARTSVRQVDVWTLNRDLWEMERAERLAKKLP